MDLTEKHKKFLIDLFYYAAILIIFFVFLKYAFGICAPFIFAALIGLILQRPINATRKKVKIPKGLLSAIYVLIIFVVFGLIIWFGGGKLVKEVASFIKHLSSKFSSYDWIYSTTMSFVNSLPDSLQKYVEPSIAKKLAEIKTAGGISSVSFGKFNLSSLISSSANGVWNTAKQIPSYLVVFLVTVIASCFFTADYDKISSSIKKMMSPERASVFSSTKSSILLSFHKLIKTYFTIMCITFSEMLIGLLVLTVAKIYTGGYIIPIALLVAIFDILPLFGTGTFVIPWALYSFVTGKPALGIGLLVMYIIITVVRQIIEPKLVSQQLELPAIVTLMAMYIGLKTIGVVGMFIFPITIFVIKMLYDEGMITLFGKRKIPVPVSVTSDVNETAALPDQSADSAAKEKVPAAKKKVQTSGKSNKAKGTK